MSAEGLVFQCFVFVGVRGGAGATTTAALAAAALAQGGFSPLLCDLDPHNAGADIALGIESRPGFRWNELAAVSEPPSSDLLIEALPGVAGFEVLAWGNAEESEVWAKADWILMSVMQAKPSRVCLVFDVARACVEQARSLLERIESRYQATGLGPISSVSRWFLVCPTDVTSVHSAARLRQQLPDDAQLIIRQNRAGGVSPREVAAALQTPQALAHEICHDPKLERAMIRGEFATYCQTKPKSIDLLTRVFAGPTHSTASAP